ncbi:hypothetical protein HKD37_20G056148 [Glycine soja]
MSHDYHAPNGLLDEVVGDFSSDEDEILADNNNINDNNDNDIQFLFQPKSTKNIYLPYPNSADVGDNQVADNPEYRHYLDQQQQSDAHDVELYVGKNILAMVEENEQLIIPTFITFVRQEFGYTITYRKAWLAKQWALEHAYGYAMTQLKFFCHYQELQEDNPHVDGVVASVKAMIIDIQISSNNILALHPGEHLGLTNEDSLDICNANDAFSLYCDGAIFKSVSAAAYQRGYGGLIEGFSRRIRFCSILEAELWALYHGLGMAVKHGIQNLVVKSDCL